MEDERREATTYIGGAVRFEWFDFGTTNHRNDILGVLERINSAIIAHQEEEALMLSTAVNDNNLE